MQIAPCLPCLQGVVVTVQQYAYTSMYIVQQGSCQGGEHCTHLCSMDNTFHPQGNMMLFLLDQQPNGTSKE